MLASYYYPDQTYSTSDFQINSLDLRYSECSSS